LLGDTVGIELEFEAQEKEVGPFRADILCKNTLDSSWVLIENQLERTDHTTWDSLCNHPFASSRPCKKPLGSGNTHWSLK
jgi:hypothetical protein